MTTTLLATALTAGLPARASGSIVHIRLSGGWFRCADAAGLCLLVDYLSKTRRITVGEA